MFTIVVLALGVRAADLTDTPIRSMMPKMQAADTGGTSSGTAPAAPLTVTGSTLTDLKLAALDLYGDFKLAKPFTTNGQATARVFAGMNTTSHELIYGAMVTVPVTDHLAIGGVVASIGGQFYEGGANVSYGVTNSLPVIGDYQAFAGDGIVYNFISRAPANYAFAGFQKTWILGSKWDLGVGVVTANTSDRAGIDVLGGLHLTYWWSGRK